MFTVTLKNNRSGIEILTTRALLALAGLAAYLFTTAGNPYLAMGVPVLLFLSSVFVRPVLEKFKVSRAILMGAAAALTYMVTRNLIFAGVLLLFGFFFQALTRKITVELGKERVVIHGLFSKKTVGWGELNNLVLKDRILTIDYKNDHILQSEIDAASYGIDENEFNRFCKDLLAETGV